MNLGKITQISFGTGGYGAAQFGLYVKVKSNGEDFLYAGEKVWDNFGTDDHRKHTKCFNMVNDIAKLVKEAGVNNSSKLIGMPVTFDIIKNDYIKNIRILTEVI